MSRNRKDPMYIETNDDGGAQTIELWCYKEAEAEVDRLKLEIHNLRNGEIPALRSVIAALSAPTVTAGGEAT